MCYSEKEMGECGEGIYGLEGFSAATAPSSNNIKILKPNQTKGQHGSAS